MNRENIKLVRDHIASLPPEQVNMGTTLEERDCGTVGCISGWAHFLGAEAGTGSYLGLDSEATEALIMPCDWLGDGRRPEPEKLYPKARVVAVLDHLLATGEVDWSVAPAQPQEPSHV